MFARFNYFALLPALLLLAACGGAPDKTLKPQETQLSYIRLAPSAPPAKMQEYVPMITKPMSFFWRPGHWEYDGINFNWIKGHYIKRPHPTAFWIADRWERHTYGWAFIPGHWK